MAIRVSTFTVEVGESQRLEVAQGEDREIRLTFTEGGALLDMTGAQLVLLTVRQRDTGILVFSRMYSGFEGPALDGTPRFVVSQSDTTNEEDGVYDCDVTWVDSLGNLTQLLAFSAFAILRRLSEPGDSITSPSPVPVPFVAYGIRRVIAQPADGDDFTVDISSLGLAVGSSYAVSWNQGTLDAFIVIQCPVTNRTSASFRAVTSRALNTGDIVEFTLKLL